MINRESNIEFFKNHHTKYFHDLLNDKFYDEVVFQGKENGYYVEVGALDGWIHSQTIHFEKLKNWDGIIVEPSPQWLEKIKEHRWCNVCTSPISDVRESNKFVVRDFLAYSHLEDIDEIYGPDEVIEVVDVQTITLVDLLDKFKAPNEIDFVSIDTEGYELRILNKFFQENLKYKINLISLEHGNDSKVDLFFKDKPYTRIKNPYLDFIKLSDMGTVRLGKDSKFYLPDGTDVDLNITDLSEINFEHYFIHNDFLANNTHLKKYIINL